MPRRCRSTFTRDTRRILASCSVVSGWASGSDSAAAVASSSVMAFSRAQSVLPRGGRSPRFTITRVVPVLLMSCGLSGRYYSAGTCRACNAASEALALLDDRLPAFGHEVIRDPRPIEEQIPRLVGWTDDPIAPDLGDFHLADAGRQGDRFGQAHGLTSVGGEDSGASHGDLRAQSLLPTQGARSEATVWADLGPSVAGRSHFLACSLRRRTPGPPPSALMNSTPLFLSAPATTEIVFGSPA